LMIGISEKEKEEHRAERGQATRHTLRTEFWHRALEALEQAGVELYQNVGPGRDHWLSAGSGLGGAHYDMIFCHDEARVDFAISRSSKEENKLLFDSLHSRRGQVEQKFGHPLEWQRLDDKKASMIRFRKVFDGHDKTSWPEMIAWLVENMRQLEAALKGEIPALRQLLAKGKA
ncbi:MAG: uncharacterized protein JWO94_2586, partial [Verrucomicrobiaceae bacterium]|nr:uncharacterized protein [Verrucomicrobiaceae bacterium]